MKNDDTSPSERSPEMAELLRYLLYSDRRKKPSMKPWVKDLLSGCPKTGNGVHNWLFRAALALHPYYQEESHIHALLLSNSAGCGRIVSDSEIFQAIRDSLKYHKDPRYGRQTQSRWPSVNSKKIEAIATNGSGLAELKKTSPVEVALAAAKPEYFLNLLFPGNPLICMGWDAKSFSTRKLSEWKGALDKVAFIVPSPMTSRIGQTKDGRETSRSLANTGPRKFLVVEFDSIPIDTQAAILGHLADYAPLSLVVHSGSKSLHGWFHCQSCADEKISAFFQYSVSLGADPATWTPCQLVRLPEGKRNNGNFQSVQYFNPATLT